MRRLALNPGMAVGECYMDGTLVPVNGSIHDVLVVLMDNTNDYRNPGGGVQRQVPARPAPALAGQQRGALED